MNLSELSRTNSKPIFSTFSLIHRIRSLHRFLQTQPYITTSYIGARNSVRRKSVSQQFRHSHTFLTYICIGGKNNCRSQVLKETKCTTPAVSIFLLQSLSLLLLLFFFSPFFLPDLSPVPNHTLLASVFFFTYLKRRFPSSFSLSSSVSLSLCLHTFILNQLLRL